MRHTTKPSAAARPLTASTVRQNGLVFLDGSGARGNCIGGTGGAFCGGGGGAAASAAVRANVAASRLRRCAGVSAAYCAASAGEERSP